MTLCQGSFIWSFSNRIRLCQTSSFSARKAVEKALVVVITRFSPSVSLIIFTTGPLTPASSKALLIEFRSLKAEKLASSALIKIKRLVASFGLALALTLDLGCTSVQFWTAGLGESV